MAKGQQLSVPETVNATIWTDDLVLALTSCMDSWTKTFQSVNEEGIEANTISYLNVAASLRNDLENTIKVSRQPARVVKGAFATTYGEIESSESHPLSTQAIRVGSSEDDREEQQTRGSGKRGRGRGALARGRGRLSTTGTEAGHKRKREGNEDSGGRRPPCRACENEYHNLERCFYVVKSLRPEGWRPIAGLERLVEMKMKESPALAAEVNQLINSHKKL